MARMIYWVNQGGCHWQLHSRLFCLLGWWSRTPWGSTLGRTCLGSCSETEPNSLGGCSTEEYCSEKAPKAAESRPTERQVERAKNTHIPSNIHQPSVRTTPSSTAQEVKQRAILAWRGSEWHGWWPVHPQDPILWYMHEPHLGGGWGCSVGVLCFLICCKDVKNQAFILPMKLP